RGPSRAAARGRGRGSSVTGMALSGGRPATLYDVARGAGVSTATVSRVVHGQDRVRAVTRRRVLDVIEALGYVPDAAAQSMATQRKEVIGFLAVENRSSDTDVEQGGLLFVEEVLRGIEAVLSEIEWSVLISLPHGNDPSAARRRMRKISAKVDGMIISEGIVAQPLLTQLAGRIPIVLVAGPADVPLDVFSADNRGGTRDMVAHLVEVHGKKRLFGVDGPPEAPDAVERRAALLDAVAEYPGVALTGSFQGQFATLSGQLAARAIGALPRRDLPDALVCANDQMAIGAIRELQQVGLRVPDDIAVVGFDDMQAGTLISPALTTARQP